MHANDERPIVWPPASSSSKFTNPDEQHRVRVFDDMPHESPGRSAMSVTGFTSSSIRSGSLTELETGYAVAGATEFVGSAPRQEELDHREGQLNARMAQFETLVRNTKLSLQGKMEEVARREARLEELETQIKSQKVVLDDRVRLERGQLEKERQETQARKMEIEEWLARRERELQEVAAERERELTLNMERYRQELEQRLGDCKADYQRRFEKRCDDLENDFILRINEEKKGYEKQLKLYDRDCQEKIVLSERMLAAKRDELQQRYERQIQENEHLMASHREELEESLQRRLAHAEEELAARRHEIESRFVRREEQIAARESIVEEAEQDWQTRHASFETQWNEFESLRRQQTEDLALRESALLERSRFLTELEGTLHRKELEQVAQEERLKSREKQVVADAQKYAKLQEMEKEVLEAQTEVTRIREGLIRERHQLQKTVESERSRIRETQEIAVKRLDEERSELARQNKKVEQMRISLDRSREELGRMHRETLEIRLATEELWLRLAGDSAPEELKESLTRIRGRLADQYQEAVRKLDLQKQELLVSRQQVLDQHEKTLRRREELDRWASESEKMLDEREDRIRDKELDLERRQIAVDDLVRRTRSERSEMEKEIALLQAQVEQMLGKRSA